MDIKIILQLVLSYGLVLGAQDTGYPAGLMADCPGMNRSTVLSEATRRSLSVVAVRPSARPGRPGRPRRGGEEAVCRLSREGAACVAAHLNLKKRKTQVLISGYMEAARSPLARSVAGAYAARGRNVLVLEVFPVLVRTYPVAARVTKPLGKLLGEFLAELSRRGLPPGRLELVGGSLGAHVASFAAVRYRQLTGSRPARLTGLDPAGPCFRNVPPTQRLHRGAAARVDALHTGADGFGLADALGHVDFYANGGEYQPSMAGDLILPCFLLCSHVRAALYWVSAIENPKQFVAVRCGSVSSARRGDCYDDGAIRSNVLGPKTNFSQPGVYYLPTKENMPYFIGDEGLKKRKYGVNNYLLKTAPEGDIIV